MGIGAGALVAASSTVHHILAHIGFAPVLLVAIAVLPPRGAHGGADTAAAGGGGVGVGRALVTAATAIVHVLAHIGLAPVLHVVVAILPPGLAHGLALAIGAGGGSVGVGRALVSTVAAVIHVLAHIGLAPIL